MMNLTQGRLIAIFKAFVEKVFAPQFHKIDHFCHQEWNKFSTMISVEQINLGELQLYVDTLPALSQTNGPSFERRNKSPMFNKSRKETQNDQPNNSIGFNPSKTFGGVRSKGPMFPLPAEFEEGEKKDYGMKDYSRESREEKGSKPQPLTTQGIMLSLERLYSNFTENQEKLGRMLSQGVVGSTPYENKSYYI